ATWMARAQKLFFELQSLGRIHTFGGIPGDVEPYGFFGLTTRGSVYVVMNPTQTVTTVTLPPLRFNELAVGVGRIQFRDAGFVPKLVGDRITLGPGQMAMVGYGAYAASNYDFGVQNDVVIPRSINPLPIDFHRSGAGSIEAAFYSPAHGTLRIIVQEMTPEGYIRRTWAGGPPNGENMGKVFALSASQQDKPVPVHIDYDKIVWSGMSWALGEIDTKDLSSGQPLSLRFHSSEKEPITLKGSAYVVEY